jgi:dihydroorotase
MFENMEKYLIRNVTVVNEGRQSVNDILISNERIEKIASLINVQSNAIEINGEGKFLLPGVIDDQVHFREPGLTHKATIATESRAAVAGGVTSFMEMPNTVPPVFTVNLLEDKYEIARKTSFANYSFYMGTSNDNADEALRINDLKDRICGIKIFMGASTGGLLVDNYLTLDKIFRESEVLIATHCEDEKIIRENLSRMKAEGRKLQPSDHPLIRDERACFESSLVAIQFAKKHNSRLHILHISTEEELRLFSNLTDLSDKRITAEVCVHHLHFTADDYPSLGNRIKCNPAIKESGHREALWKALLDDRLDVIATDHAPHTIEEKAEDYERAHAGLPLVQHSLLLMLYYSSKGMIPIERVVEKTSHAVARAFNIAERGFIREGYFADLVLVDPATETKVSPQNTYYKCGWSPLNGMTFPASVTHTFVNGHLVFENGKWNSAGNGKRLAFDR